LYPDHVPAPMPAANARSPSASVNVPFLIGAAILCGIGVAAMSLWMVTQSFDYFGLGVLCAVVGGFLLFQKGTGADAA